MNEELNKKIAEWVDPVTFGDGITEEQAERNQDMLAPSGKVILPDFTTFLDACVEYVVPKLREQGYGVVLFDFYDPSNKRVFWFFNITKDGVVEMSNISGDDTPALALCRAVEKLIDEETKP